MTVVIAGTRVHGGFLDGKYEHEPWAKTERREKGHVRGNEESRKGEKERRVGLVSILSEPRISEFEFVPLSGDSIVIAYLRGACSPGQPYPPTLCDAMRRPTRRHACMHVLACFRHAKPSASIGTFIAGRESYTRPSFVFSRVSARDGHSLTASSSRP